MTHYGTAPLNPNPINSTTFLSGQTGRYSTDYNTINNSGLLLTSALIDPLLMAPSHQTAYPSTSTANTIIGAASLPSTNQTLPTAYPPASDSLLLTLRTRPQSRVFRALFQYLPLRDSPNENPQLELSLNPGDIILVKGEMDSDGFYQGETLDGRSGLVPSNYVERVPDSVLLANARAPSPSFPLRVPPHLNAIQHDFSSPDNSVFPDSVCPYPPADVTKVTVQEIKNNDLPRVPCPRDLVVEKKLSRSVVVSWSPPEESFVPISQYHVCVDGAVRAVVPGSYKCRALVEDVDLDRSINLSVRAVTEQGHSPDAACTIALGNDAQVAPQQLRVWAVTPVSACVRWYPSNANAEHIISLNAIKVGVCPPTVFQVQLQGLCPSTIYRVSVRTKHPKAVLEQRPVERCLDFKTLPKIGLPDPPQGVQVELGPQPGTLLVSWQPVTNQPKPPSRAAIHSYLIYADGKNIAQVPSASADHALLRLADLSDDPPIFITVRTRTREGSVSADSNVARVPRGQCSATTAAGQSTSTAAALIDPATGQIFTQQQPLPLFDMTSSYPSYANHHQHVPYGHSQLPNAYNAQTGPLSGPLPSAPYTAPPALLSSAYPSTHPLATATAFTANLLSQQPPPQGAGGQFGTASGTLGQGPFGTFDRTGQVAAQAALNAQAAALQQQQQLLLQQSSLSGVAQPTLQSTLSKWKQPPSMLSQYYTFHPRLLRAEPSGVEDTRPSVLEMENNYLLRHRQAEWASQSDAQARIDAYARATHRAGSADGRLPTRHRLVPPRLARVKSESGFGTRSEPDLRPPTLDDDCRWFVALFDYDHHMSPNANAEAEELSFRKHQLIKVYGECDPDGFYHGQIGNRHGLVPSNMVIEIAKDDLLPSRVPAAATTVASAAEPALRRMRWGSLKSRSYDHAGDRRTHDRPVHSYYSSLDRRDVSAGPRSDRGRWRMNGAKDADYGYRRDYEERYSSALPRRGTDDYGSRDRDRDYREESDYRELKYRDSRDRDRAPYEREPYYDEPPRDRRSRHDSGPTHGTSNQTTDGRDYRGPGQGPRVMPGREIRHPMDEGYDMDRGYGPPSGPSRYDHQQPGPSGMGTQMGPQMGAQGPMSQAPMAQLNHQMSGMQLGQPQAAMGHMGQMGSQQMSTPMMGQSSQMMGQQPPMMGQMGQGVGLQGIQNVQGMPGPTTSQQVAMIPSLLNEASLNGLQQRKMVAKFDYDSRQLSPNVDAEQVELSFRQGDVITVYGEMDEDGFYMGELNGQRGLVPSNFLQTSPLTSLAPSQPTEPMRKGVAFQDAAQAVGAKRVPPVRQTSQTTPSGGGGPLSVAAAATAMSAVTKVAGGPKKSIAGQATGGGTGAAAGGAGKTLTKKTSDVGKGAAPNTRKTSTAVKKSDSNVKKKS